jgi:cytochrome c oxidase subunit IV
MAEMADSQHDAGHHGPKVQVYLVIGLALAIFTIVSFVVNAATRSEPPMLTHDQGFWIILSVAIIKAALVVSFFMHLVWDWRKVAFMIVPALILGTMMAIVLMPDIVLAWHPHDIDPPADQSAKPEHTPSHP